LEPEDTYKNLEVDLSAFVTRERHRNISYLLSRYSTLGMDYYEQGIEPVFLDYEKHTMDFLDSDSFIKFNDPESFYEWVETEL
jgi:hypothetical protein